MIERKKYLDKLISRKNNGMVKVINRIRRCCKSYLQFNIYDLGGGGGRGGGENIL